MRPISSSATTAPTASDVLTKFLSPVNVEEQYVGQLQTLLIAPFSGDYTFYMSSDDNGLLYLSTDENPANKKLIAKEPTWNGTGDWNTIARRAGCGTADAPATDCEHRSDQFADTEWATKGANGKAKITLVQGKKYYVEVVWSEGGGGDNGGATFTKAGDPTPANGTTALTGTAIEWYGPSVVTVPVITTKPAASVVLARGDKLSLKAAADGKAPLSYQWYKTGVAIAGATTDTYSVDKVDNKDVGNYYCVAKNALGSAQTDPVGTRVSLKAPFVIEAEDFNLDGGKSIAAASAAGYTGNGYDGKSAVSDVDYHRADVEASEDATYRKGEAPNVPMNANGDFERGDITMTANYKIGWAGNHWYNYTRTLAAGSYNVFAGLSHGDPVTTATRVAGKLEVVTGDITKPDQAVAPIGTFDGPATGGWGANELIPLLAADKSMAVVTVAGGSPTTLRATVSNGDFDFLLFYPTTSVPPTAGASAKLTDGKVVITFKGTLQGSENVAGPFTDIAGATSPRTVDPVAVGAAKAKYYRQKP